MQIDRGSGRFVYLDHLAVGGSTNINLAHQNETLPLSELQEKIGGEMADLLVEHGLYPAEAKAMVATWRDSWFGEDGLRVLYMLPRAWTERVLPLNIQPAPAETVRVMVGRAEVLQPSKEWLLLKEVVRYSESEGNARRLAVNSTKAIGLGRFTEAAIRHLTTKLPNRQFGEQAWALLEAMQAKRPEGKSLARK